MLFDTQKSILQELQSDLLKQKQIRLLVKRDDMIHSEVSGNKWRKLKYNVEQFKINRKKNILTFGGAYSNHLLATAAACHTLKIPSIGFVRGEELSVNSNENLRQCEAFGMKLKFVSRQEYALRNDYDYLKELSYEYSETHLIPEGGANYWGIIGCQEIVTELPPFDHLFVAQGTSTTSCGLLLGLDHQRLHVVPAIKNYDSIREMTNLFIKAGFDSEMIEDLLNQVEVHNNFHFGGYAKWNNELLDFMQSCKENHQLELDKIYTGKAFFALIHEITNSNQYNQSKIVFLHTGGLCNT